MAFASDSTTTPARQQGLLPDELDLLAAFEHDFAALIAQPWPEMPPEPLLPAESTATTANDASALASESASESTALLLPLPAPLPSIPAALARRRAIFGAVAETDLPTAARALHARRALEAALGHGMALLEALGLPPVSPAIDRAIRTLDALDAPGEDMEDGDDAEQDRADEELSLGWTTSVSQIDLGDNADDVEGVNEDGSDDGREEPGWFLPELDVPLILRGMMEDARRVGAGAHA